MSRPSHVGRASPGEASSAAERAGALDLEVLYRRHWRDVIRYVSRTFGAGPPTPEDVAQQAFVRLAANGSAVDIHNPKAFLFRSARNFIIDEHRRAAAQRTFLESGGADLVEPGAEPSVERVITARECLKIVADTIHAMPPERRRSFLMHRLQGLSFAEIARRTGYSEAGVRHHVLGALKDLERAAIAADIDQVLIAWRRAP